ncbi:MAG: tetratricopeptide repeat protein, partial [Chloroflexota bacterium]
MNSTSNLGQLIFAIEPFLLTIGGPIVALIITYFRRRSQAKADPQIRFDKSLLRASVDTFGGIVIIWAILFFLFPIQNNQIRFAPQLSWLVENPIIGIGVLIFIPILVINLFLWYLLRGAKPPIYRGDYEAGLKFVRGLMWFPTMNHVLTNLQGSIYQFIGRYKEAEVCFRKVEAYNAKKKNRQSRGSNLGSLGWALLRQNRYSEALEVLQNSIEFYPEGSDNFSGMGETLLWMGKPAEAMPYFERGIENKRYRMKTDQFVWSELLANKAWALAQMGSFDEARLTYKQALDEAEQDMRPALAGLHVRGAYIYRLMGEDAQAIGELNMALQLDPNGGYGQLAKEALEVPQERIGMAQLAIAAAGEAVIAAIRHSTSPQRTIKVIRENLMLVAQGKDYSIVYLLRPQEDCTTVLQAVLEQTALVEAAVNNTDLKAGITVLMTNLKAKSSDNSYITEHLKTISRAALLPTAESADASVPTSTYDAAAVFDRKPLPSVTAKNRPSGGLNPSWYASMAFIMTPLLSSLALSYFWRRLGKPRWMWISIACTLLLPIVAIGGTLFLFRILPASLRSLAILSGVGAWYGFSFALASILEEPYKQWHQGGKEAIANYPYKWKRGILLGLGVMVGASLLGMLVNVSRPGPQQ